MIQYSMISKVQSLFRVPHNHDTRRSWLGFTAAWELINFDDRFTITQSAIFKNQPQILWITASSIDLKLIKVALD